MFCFVFVDNDVNLVVNVEYFFGVVCNIDNFVVIIIEYGVGMGIFING